MTQSIFNSVRKLNFYNFKTKYINQNDSVGELFKKQTIEDFGSIPEPSCLDYNAELGLLAICSKKGLIKIFGAPGICYTTRLEGQDEIWNFKFINGTNYFVTLTSENKIILWIISSLINELVKVDTISNLHLLSNRKPSKLNQIDYNNNGDQPVQQNITAIEVIDFTSSIIMGNGEGSIIQLKLDMLKMQKQSDITNAKSMSTGSPVWQTPTKSDVIDKERIISKLPVGSQNRVILDTVMHISARPGSRKQILIGYCSGHSVIYDLQKDTVEYLLSSKVPLHQLSWCPPDPIIQDSFLVSPDNNKPQYHLSNILYSSHEDGSLIMWKLSQNDDAILALDSKPIFPHGNNQKCLSISKFLWKKYNRGQMFIFTGGLPRSEYMSKSTITIMNTNCIHSPTNSNNNNNNNILQHVVLDLTSQLIDFSTIDDENDCAKYLLVLAEEEFFIVDLTKDDWPILHDEQPYLNCLHHSPITAYHFLSEVESDWFKQLNEVSCQKIKLDNLAFEKWPIKGNIQKKKNEETCQQMDIWKNDLLVIGHGDGTIAFWRLGLGGALHHIAVIKSSNIFKMPDENNINYGDYEDEIIPFRRVGLFDPCCDDNRFAIQLIHYTGRNILIGGYGGQVVLWGFVDQSFEKQILEVDLTTHLSNFRWKGCQPFQHVETVQNDSKFKTMLALTIFPPSQITAMDIFEDSEINDHILVACGTLHGLVMVACPKKGKSEAFVVTTHCTVSKNSVAAQEAALGEGWARRRTRELKKSLRSSFRRLRRRSTKRMEHPNISRNKSTHMDDKSVKVELVENEIEFEEREIEDRPKDTANDGLIRSIKIHISTIRKKSPAGAIEKHLNLFAGSYGGLIMWFQSDSTNGNISLNHTINMRLIKPYQFQHRAPVVYFNMLSSELNHPPLNTLNETVKSEYDFNSIKKQDQLVVLTEEQIRIYSFPSFVLKCKLRVTAHDGFRIKNGNIISFNDERLNNNTKETLICATNNGGQFLILNASNLKRKDVVQFVDKTDLMALNFMSLATSFLTTNLGSTLPYGIYYSGQGQVTLFEIISKFKTSSAHSNNYISNRKITS